MNVALTYVYFYIYLHRCCSVWVSSVQSLTRRTERTRRTSRSTKECHIQFNLSTRAVACVACMACTNRQVLPMSSLRQMCTEHCECVASRALGSSNRNTAPVMRSNTVWPAMTHAGVEVIGYRYAHLHIWVFTTNQMCFHVHKNAAIDASPPCPCL